MSPSACQSPVNGAALALFGSVVDASGVKHASVMLIAEPPFHLKSHLSTSPFASPSVFTFTRMLPIPAVNHMDKQYVIDVT